MCVLAVGEGGWGQPGTVRLSTHLEQQKSGHTPYTVNCAGMLEPKTHKTHTPHTRARLRITITWFLATPCSCSSFLRC